MAEATPIDVKVYCPFPDGEDTGGWPREYVSVEDYQRRLNVVRIERNQYEEQRGELRAALTELVRLEADTDVAYHDVRFTQAWQVARALVPKASRPPVEEPAGTPGGAGRRTPGDRQAQSVSPPPKCVYFTLDECEEALRSKALASTSPRYKAELKGVLDRLDAARAAVQEQSERSEPSP